MGYLLISKQMSFKGCHKGHTVYTSHYCRSSLYAEVKQSVNVVFWNSTVWLYVQWSIISSASFHISQKTYTLPLIINKKETHRGYCRMVTCILSFLLWSGHLAVGFWLCSCRYITSVDSIVLQLTGYIANTPLSNRNA